MLQTKLCAAIKEGNELAVRKLLGEDGADPAGPGDDNPARLPMYFAAKGGYGDLVALLLEHNADLNLATTSDGVTPAYIAAAYANAGCLKVLLKHSADPNLGRTATGAFPAYIAAQQGHVECLKLLLAFDANPNQGRADTRETPAHMAAQNGNMECLKLLLVHNSDPNQTTNSNLTPLHAAAVGDELHAAQLLVVHGASMAATTVKHHTAAEVAKFKRHWPLVEWLNAVATWSPLRVAAGLRMHTAITFLLQQGQLDPDDRAKFPATEVMAAVAASTATPAELPWEDALPTCRATIKLVRDASFGWKDSTHRLYHANVRKAVFAVLGVVERLGRGGCENNCTAADESSRAPIPLLPPEIWLFILQFFQRSWWSVVGTST